MSFTWYNLSWGKKNVEIKSGRRLPTGEIAVVLFAC